MSPERTRYQDSLESRDCNELPTAAKAPTKSSNSSNTRRRRMAIEDMLNPSDDDQRASVSPSMSSLSESSASACADIDHTLAKEPVYKRSSRPSPTRKPRYSPYARSHTSRSSSSEDRSTSQSRSFRPAYAQEQEEFVWFHRIDIRLPWPDVNVAYQEQYPGAERNKQGLQCKYYRIRDAYGLPKCRAAEKTPEDSQKFGMWANTGHRYPWMEPYAAQLPGFLDSQNSPPKSPVKRS